MPESDNFALRLEKKPAETKEAEIIENTRTPTKIKIKNTFISLFMKKQYKKSLNILLKLI